jgi:hypothetical protein
MKKLLLLITMALVTFSSQAQDNNYTNFINSSGNFEYEREIITSGSKEKLQNRVKDWFMTSYTNYSKDAVIDGDIEQGNFTIRGTFQNKTFYNPFAGYYSENTTYLFKVSIEENVINFRIFGVKVSSTYVGWGANKGSIDLSEVVQKIATAKATLSELQADKKSSKKAIKEQKEIIKDETERLDSIIPTLNGIIQSFEKEMNK